MNMFKLWKLYRLYHHLTKGGTMLNGWKTYLCAVGIGIVTTAKALGYLDEASYQTIVGMLGAGGLAALRAGVAKS